MTVDSERLKDPGEAELEFTGERFHPDVHGEIELEHVHRYLQARDLVAGKAALDIACGEGYGSNILADTAEKVIGVDISKEAVDHARATYTRINLEFLQGDCANIPVPDASVDVVVSFETIEHHTQHVAMFEEIKRVLRKGGVLLISSPDRQRYSIDPGYDNPYHVKELFEREFKDLVGSYFRNVKFWGQRVMYGSTLLPEDDLSRVSCYWWSGGQIVSGDNRPIYWIGLASDEPLPPLASGVFEQPLHETHMVQGHLREVADKNETITHLKLHVSELKQHAAGLERKTHILERDHAANKLDLVGFRAAASRNAETISAQAAKIDHLNRVVETQRKELARFHMQPSLLARKLSQSAGRRLGGHRLDPAFYLTAYPDVRDAGTDPSEHYRRFGKSEGRFPSLNAYLRANPQAWDTEMDLKLVRTFEPEFYANYYTDIKDAGANPLFHFLEHGWREGRFGSFKEMRQMERGVGHIPEFDKVVHDFDSAFYVERYRDVQDATVDPFHHYLRHGISQGRLPSLNDPGQLGSFHELDPVRDTVIIVIHDGSRSGAPIVAWNVGRELVKAYNVISIVCGEDGPMRQAFRDIGAIVPSPVASFNIAEAARSVVANVAAQARIKYAIVNSLASRTILSALSEHFIPTISLVHEFDSYVKPSGALFEATFWSNEVVFSSTIARDASTSNYFDIQPDRFPVIPQGRCELPPPADGHLHDAAAERTRIRATLKLEPPVAGQQLVIGMGSVLLRKGVDLFIQCCAEIKKLMPSDNLRFVWVGTGFNPGSGDEYSIFLREAIERLGVGNEFAFLSEVSDLSEIYAAADCMLLPSRLDPLPNTAVDAVAEGLAIVCFEGASGMVEHFQQDDVLAQNVVAHLDVGAMAARTAQLLGSAELRQTIAERSRGLARAEFDVVKYSDRLDRIGSEIAALQSRERRDVEIIEASGLLRRDYALADWMTGFPHELTARTYVRQWASGLSRRKPFPGFHPGIYAERLNLGTNSGDPLARWIESGRPVGPWLSRVIDDESPISATSTLRIALHVHAFYPELMKPITNALSGNSTPIDLFVTVASDEARSYVEQELGAYTSGAARVDIVPNHGRDIGPFLGVLSEHGSSYDVLGHIHTKKTELLGDNSIGERWFTFLLNNLLGSDRSVADIVLGQMASDSRLGLVYPDDPNIVTWGTNYEIATELGSRLDLAQLPVSLSFPVGTMFWARTQALKSLMDLNLTQSDLPIEPIPYDGTVLHALERMLPVLATHSGFDCAVTAFPGPLR